MARPPRNPAARLFSAGMVARALAQGGLSVLLLGAIYLLGARQSLPIAELRSLVFFALVAAILALILANRSFHAVLSHAVLRGNVAFRYVLGFIAVVSALILTVPSIQRVFALAPLGIGELALVALTGGGLLLLFEGTKRIPWLARG